MNLRTFVAAYILNVFRYWKLSRIFKYFSYREKVFLGWSCSYDNLPKLRHHTISVEQGWALNEPERMLILQYKMSLNADMQSLIPRQT